MKPFNLEQALKGKPVVTRDGRRVKNVKIDSPGEIITAELVLHGSGNKATLTFTIEGQYYGDNTEDAKDLFMADRASYFAYQ